MKGARLARLPAAGKEHTRIERGQPRTLATVFGKVTVTLIAYRATGAADLHPADAVLNLPAGMHSHGPAAWPRWSLPAARSTGPTNGSTPAAGIGKRQIAELAMTAAPDIDVFYDAPARLSR